MSEIKEVVKCPVYQAKKNGRKNEKEEVKYPACYLEKAQK